MIVQGVLFSVGWSAVVSFVIVMSISLVLGLRVTDAEEMVCMYVCTYICMYVCISYK